MSSGTIKASLWKAMHSFGAFRLIKLITKECPRILMYHRFGPVDTEDRIGVRTFERQIQMLHRSLKVIPLRELSSRMADGRPLDPYTVVLTVDDGYDDFYRYAYPVLKKYSMPATLYVTTDFVDEKIWLWPDFIKFIINHTGFKDYSFRQGEEGLQYQLDVVEDRRRAWSDIADYCLTLRNETKNVFLKDLAKNLQVDVPVTPDQEYHGLSWEQIREMSQNGIEIGSHTCTHPRLVMVESQKLFREISGSKSRIESMLGSEVDSFAYPHGARTDFDANVKRLVREVGYKNAMAAYFDLDPLGDIYEVKRFGVGSDMKHFINVIYGVEFISRVIGRS